MRQWLQLIKEATPGTTPTADAANSIWVDLETSDPAINLVPAMFTIRSAMPHRGVTNRLAGSAQDNISGSISTALYHEQANFWHDTVFEPTVTGTFNVTSLPTVTVNRGWLDETETVRYEQYKRCIFTGFSLTGSNAASGAPMRLTVNLIGGEYNGGATIAPPSCSAFPDELYLWSMCDMYLNNASIKTYLSSLTIAATHTITPKVHMNRFADSFRHGGWEPSLTAGMDMFSHAYRTQFLDIRTAFADAIYATNNYVEMTYAVDKKVRFNLFNAMFQALNPERVPGQPHMQNATVVPFYDCTNYDMNCTITNPA
jgi:hypothetical protein